MRSVAVSGELLSGLEEQAASAVARIYRLGRYQVIAELARGGMGVVYLALARGPGAFHKLLVLKELKREMRADPHLVGMFMEEARLAACLSHPNVVHTIEAGSDGDRHYIAMEYLDGQSMHRVVARARRAASPASFAWQTSVLCSAIEGLAYAHSALDYDGRPLGIVHRDMSPHNVMVGYDGHVKVLDFGIAKATASSADTQSGLLKGKVSYMSPEQAAGLSLDKRADVFAVGVMLWEVTTGRRFWAGLENDMQILRALMMGQVGTSREHSMAQIPGQLQHVIARATAPRPEERYESATALLVDLRSALASCGVIPLAPADIGKFTLELFQDDRAKLQASIDQALTLARRPASGVYTGGEEHAAGEGPASPPVDALPTLETADASDDVTPSDVPLPASSDPSSHVSTIAPPFTRTTVEPRRAVGGPLWGAVSAIAIGVVAALAAFVALQRSAGPSRTLALASPLSATPPLASAPPVRREPERVHLAVRASPATARILVDRQLVPGNPWGMTLPSDGASHTVRVEADGFVPGEDRFDATGDVTLVIALERSGVNTTAPVPVQAGTPAAAAPAESGPVRPRARESNPYPE